ncbi:MAG TPA: hypothetical protein VFZ33_16940 [Chitinophagaceae bacterium]
MRNYSNTITLSKNARGIYSIDTVLGCSSGTAINKNGCYNDCYAARISRAYGYDFTKSTVRYFKNENHKHLIASAAQRVPLPFVRIGTMGDPSEAWGHTVSVCEAISSVAQLKIFHEPPKEIVIITKHWKKLTDEQLMRLGKINVCINTSVSALDELGNISEMLYEYERIKPYCKSVLRVVSCDFNIDNETGHNLHKIQAELFKHSNTLDTVFRPSKNNPFVTSGVINVKKEVFNGKKQLASKFNRKTYMGKCSTCSEMCGANFKKP